MIRREMTIAVVILLLCGLGALSTLAIYRYASSTLTTSVLLLPLFAVIAIAILVPELLFRRIEVTAPATPDFDGQRVLTVTGYLVPAAATVIVFVSLSLPAGLPARPIQRTNAGIVPTTSGHPTLTCS